MKICVCKITFLWYPLHSSVYLGSSYLVALRVCYVVSLPRLYYDETGNGQLSNVSQIYLKLKNIGFHKVTYPFSLFCSFSDLFACWTVGVVMSGRVKRQGGSSAALEQATLSINERILKECHTLYTDPDKGKTICKITHVLFFIGSKDTSRWICMPLHWLTGRVVDLFKNVYRIKLAVVQETHAVRDFIR